LDFTKLRKLKIREHTQWNYSYYPVTFESEAKLLEIQQKLTDKNIIPRRYFYPSLNTLPYVNYKAMPVAEDIAKRVLCLPLYVGLTKNDLELIIKLIN